MSTRIAIHCYAGDAPLVRDLLPLHQRLGLPITILSPEDAPVNIPGFDCRVGGKQQSIGPLAVERQREHMRVLLTYPEDHFLMHDADSVCISRKLPSYLYAEPDVLWSNLVANLNPGEAAPYLAASVSRIAAQPPVFASRYVMEQLLAVAEPPMDGFIDHWFVQAATRAWIVHKGFQNGVSSTISTHPGSLELAQIEARYKGAVFFHSVKSPRFFLPLVDAHEAWLADSRVGLDRRPADNAFTTANMHPVAAHEFKRSVWSGDKMVYQDGLTPGLVALAPVNPPRPRRDQIGRLIP